MVKRIAGAKTLDEVKATLTPVQRAAVKKRVNTLLGSRIVEEKSYKSYRPTGD